jgi:hypothetical protein
MFGAPNNERLIAFSMITLITRKLEDATVSRFLGRLCSVESSCQSRLDVLTREYAINPDICNCVNEALEIWDLSAFGTTYVVSPSLSDCNCGAKENPCVHVLFVRRVISRSMKACYIAVADNCPVIGPSQGDEELRYQNLFINFNARLAWLQTVSYVCYSCAVALHNKEDADSGLVITGAMCFAGPASPRNIQVHGPAATPRKGRMSARE